MNKSLARNALYNVIYSVLNVLFPLFSAAYISRVLAPEGIGRVAYAQNIVSWFVMFAALGIPEYGTREAARLRDDKQRLSRLFSELMGLNFLATAVCVGAYGLFLRLACPEDGALYLVCGLELVVNFFSIDWLYRGLEDYGYITLRSGLIKALSLLALVTLVKRREDVVLYALIVCMGTLCSAVWNMIHARKIVCLTLRGWELGRHRKPVLALMLSSVTASLYSKVDITMLGWLASEETVGFYTNAYKAVSIVITLTAAVTAVFLPRLSYVYESDKKQYEAYLSTGLKIVLTLAFPCCFGLMAVAEDLVAVLFGTLFAPAAATIRILAVLVIVRGAGDLMCYQAIISSGNERKLIKARLAAGLVNIALNAMLIPRYAHNGAAAASLVSELIVNGILLRHSLGIAKPKISRGFLISLLTGTAAMTAAVLCLRQFMKTGLAALCASVTVGAAVYVLAGLLTKNDLLWGMKNGGSLWMRE